MDTARINICVSIKYQYNLVKAQVCVAIQTSFVLLNNTTKLQNYKALMMDDWMSMEQWWNNIDRAAPKYPNKNLSLYHTDHNKSQAERCRIKPRPLHGTYVKHNVHLSAWIITNMHKSKKNIYIYFGTTVRYCLNSIVISTILKSGPWSVTKNLFMPQKYLLN
jgi:hypothetical protein